MLIKELFRIVRLTALDFCLSVVACLVLFVHIFGECVISHCLSNVVCIINVYFYILIK